MFEVDITMKEVICYKEWIGSVQTGDLRRESKIGEGQ